MTVKFPGLSLELTLNRIAFSIGGIDVYWYAILIVASMLFCLILAIAFDRKTKKDDLKGLFNIDIWNLLVCLIFAVPFGLIGARLYYVIFNYSDFTGYRQILNIRDGGLAIYGGMIGGALGILLGSKIQKLNAIDVLDYFAIFLPFAQAVGRWGNFINGECYGVQTDLPWKMEIIKDGVSTGFVHPTFLYESIACFIIFIVMLIKKNRRKFSGEMICLYFILYGLARAVIEFFRSDSLYLGPVKVSMLLSIVLVIMFIILLRYNKHYYKKREEQRNRAIKAMK